MSLPVPAGRCTVNSLGFPRDACFREGFQKGLDFSSVSGPASGCGAPRRQGESQVLEMSVVLASRLFFWRPISPPLLPYVVWVDLCLLPDSGGRHATEAWHMGTPHCLSCGDWVQVGHTSHAWPMRGNSGTFTRACKGHILWSPANR